MYRPLLIEFDYKVINNATGQIVRTFWENMPSEEWDPTIICARRENAFRSKWKVYEYEDNPQLTRWLQGLRHIGLADIVYQPDMVYHIWGKRVLRNVNNVIENGKVDYIHSLCAPYGPHMVAMELKKRTGLPWIAQFYDPWIGNISCFKTSFFRKRFEKMEYEIVKNADYIIHDNITIVNEWIARYGSLVSGKIISIPLTFNKKNLPEIRHIENKDKLVFSHIGHIYESRSLKDIVDAVRDLLFENPELQSKIEFMIVGKVDNAEKKYIINNNLDNIFNFVGLVSPEKIDRYYQMSDVFIALDLNYKMSLSYPSKLMLYYYYQKPIIGITTQRSVMESDLLKSRNRVFYYGDSRGIKEYLRNIIIDNNQSNEFDKDYWKKFTIESGMCEYKKIVERVLSVKTEI